MTQLDTTESLSDADVEYLAKMRHWVVGHYDNAEAYQSVEGKLRLIQTILDNQWVAKDETWKLQALGTAFGDALHQYIPEYEWIAYEDEYGRDPALRWGSTSIVSFPLTTISKRVEAEEPVDIYDLFNNAIDALENAIALNTNHE